MFLLKYSESVYTQKIERVEGHLTQLKNCLTSLENLKDNMYEFWNDEHARLAAQNLVTEIRQVKNSIQRTEDWLILYKSIINHMGRSNDALDELASEAQSALDALGI